MKISLKEAIEREMLVSDFYRINMGREMTEYLNKIFDHAVKKYDLSVACNALEITIKKHVEDEWFSSPMSFAKYFNGVCRNIGAW